MSENNNSDGSGKGTGRLLSIKGGKAESSEIEKAVKALEQDLPHYIRFEKMCAQRQYTRYSELIKQGFKDDQALVLVGRMTF